MTTIVCRVLVDHHSATTTDRSAIATISSLPNPGPHNHSTLLRWEESLLLATRLLIGRGVVGRLVVTSRLVGACVSCSPFAHSLEETSMPCLGAEPRSEAMEAPPTPSAKNTWVMATGKNEGRWRCCSGCSSSSSCCCENLAKK